MGSFQFVSEEDIAPIPCVNVLTPDPYYGGRGSQEVWSCAFAPDESCFAWSNGSPFVYVISWQKVKKLTACLEDKDKVNEDDLQQECQSIDCDYCVLSVAIGWGHSKQYRSHWTKFDFTKGLILAVGLTNSRIRLYTLLTGVFLHELMDHSKMVRSLSFAPDESGRLISGSCDKNIKVWDMKEDGNLIKTINVQIAVVTCSWSPNAQFLVTAGLDKRVFVWNMNTYKLSRTLTGHCHHVLSTEFSTDGALLATASCDTRINLWDVYTGERMASFGHLFPPPSPIYAGGSNGKWVRTVSMSKDGQHIASIADDCYLRIWDAGYQDDPSKVSYVEDAVGCRYSPSGKFVAVGTKAGSVALFSVPLEVQPLQHLCRLTIRRLVPTLEIDKLELPHLLRKYLQYKYF